MRGASRGAVAVFQRLDESRVAFSGWLRCVEKNMKENSFLEQIGRTVVALCRNIPRGVLVFLPSYALLRKVGLLWRESEVSRAGRGMCPRRDVLMFSA